MNNKATVKIPGLLIAWGRPFEGYFRFHFLSVQVAPEFNSHSDQTDIWNNTSGYPREEVKSFHLTLKCRASTLSVKACMSFACRREGGRRMIKLNSLYVLQPYVTL